MSTISQSQIEHSDKAPTTFSHCPHSNFADKNCRNLVLCIDGSGNKFGKNNTNVIELYNLLSKNTSARQHCWYNSGVGTYAGSSAKSMVKTIYHTIDLAFAWNVERTVLGAYRWLSDTYEDGDCIFLFGFSRGAYQIRVLSAMIHKVGLIHRGNIMQIPFAYEIYADHRTGLSDEVILVGAVEKSDEHTKTTMAARFKSAFCHENVKIHFVGAWDTVSSVGLAGRKNILPGTNDGMTHVCYFRHALALDERRVKFLPEYAYGGASKPSSLRHQNTERSVADTGSIVDSATQIGEYSPIEGAPSERSQKQIPRTLEVWFAGTHSDIGGGNVQNAGMNRGRPPLRWMVLEAGALGLRTSPFKRELSADEQIDVKESLTGAWKILEYLPIRRLTYSARPNGKEQTRRPHRGSGRKIQEGQKLHGSLLLSQKLGNDYKPKARPPSHIKDFWNRLQKSDELKDWVEVDFLKYIEDLYRIYLIDKRDVLKALRQAATWNDGKQAVYDVGIKILESKLIGSTTVTSDMCLQLIHIFLDALKTGNGLHLRWSTDLRSLLLDLIHGDARKDCLKFILLFGMIRPKILYGYNHSVQSVMFSPKCERIIGSHDKTIQIWDVHRDSPVDSQLTGHSDIVTSVAVSPNEMHLVSGSADKTLRLWNMETGSQIGDPWTGHTGDVNCVAFSKDGRRVVSGSDDRTVRLWNVDTGTQIGEPLIGHNDRVWCVAYSPADNIPFVASASEDSTVRIWDPVTHRQVGVATDGNNQCLWSVSFSPDGQRIVSGSSDTKIRLWDVGSTTPTFQNLINGHTSNVNSVSCSPNGNLLVSGSDDNTVRIWDVESGTQVGESLRGHENGVTHVTFSPDGKEVVSASWDSTVCIWNIDDYVEWSTS